MLYRWIQRFKKRIAALFVPTECQNGREWIAACPSADKVAENNSSAQRGTLTMGNFGLHCLIAKETIQLISHKYFYDKYLRKYWQPGFVLKQPAKGGVRGVRKRSSVTSSEITGCDAKDRFRH
jgi:hypothetical protein